MNRTAIDRLVADVESRASEVNTDDRFVIGFAMLGIFGSVFNQEAKDFGDLDLFFRTEFKPYWDARRKSLDGRWQSDMNEHDLRHFPVDANTRYLGSIAPGVFTRPLQHIKARRGRISLHNEDDIEALERTASIPQRLLFGSRTAHVPK
jgi:hypothetical protein